MAEHDTWRAWPIWSAVFVGALSALAVGLIIGLIGYAVGAHQLSGPRSTSWSNVRMISAVFSILGAFFAFVAGGWIAARIAGFRRAEPAMLHGAVVWLLTIPAFLVLGAFGATAAYGGWYGGITSSPAWMGQLPAAGGDVAAAVRNTALANVAALLLGLVGSVLGGWMASGEPMSWTYYRRRTLDDVERPRRVA